MENKKKFDIKSITKTIGNFSYIFIFLAIFIAYVIINHNGISWNGIMNILRHSAVVGIMAFGMGLVIITGGIDLSVGSMLALIGGMSVVVFNATNNILLTILTAIILGAFLGFINGFLIGKFKMPAFIVTLGTMLIYRSIAQYYLRAAVKKSIYNMDGNLSSYSPFYNFGQAKLLTVPVAGILLILITVIMVYISTSTKFGKSVYAVGSNQKAARLAGVNVEWTTVSVYIITGILCGISAVIWLAMNGSVDPATLGKNTEMYAIAAVVIGGISMSGGKGKLLGIFFGALSYTVIDKIIASLNIDALINDTIKGSILLLAVFIQIIIPMIRSKIKTTNANLKSNSSIPKMIKPE